MIVLPKFKDIYVPPVELFNGYQGYFKFEAINRESGKRRVLADWFPNLMLTSGLELMATRIDYHSYCRVGTGTTPPVVGDNDIETNVSDGESAIFTGRTGAGVDDIRPYAYQTQSYTFPQALTATISEVVVGPHSTQSVGGLSRALILDGGGSPTTITILAIEILVVTYQLRAYGPAADITGGTVTIGGIVYDTIIRMADIDNTYGSAYSWASNLDNACKGFTNPGAHYAHNGDIGLVTSQPSGTSNQSTSTVNATYIGSSLEREFAVHWGVDSGNLTNGIRSIKSSAQACGQWQIQFNGPSDEYIEKDLNKTLDVTFKCSWGQHVP